MISTWTKGIIYFLSCLLLQVLIFNNIYFLRMATPFIYLLFIIKLPLGTPKPFIILISFLMGFAIDMFSNTPGIHAAACTLTGFCRPFIIEWQFIGKDKPEVGAPSFALFSKWGYFRYLTTLTLIQNIMLFLVESFTHFDPLYLLIRVVGSTLLTVLLLFAIESLNFEYLKNEG
jgi:rod shape-determining protein MreD